jgi:hypothetical protein
MLFKKVARLLAATVCLFTFALPAMTVNAADGPLPPPVKK